MKNELNNGPVKNPWKLPYPKEGVTTQNIPEVELPASPEMRKGMRGVIVKVLTFLMWTLVGMRKQHAEKMPMEGPVIVIAEHKSILDIPMIHLSNKSWIYWLAKIELFQNRFGYRFFPWFGAIPVDRANMHVRTARDVLTTLREKKILGVFPQGKRCATEEEIRTTEPKMGVVSFAMRSGAKILPVAVEKNYRLFRPNRVIYGDLHEIRLPEGQKKLSDADGRALALQMMQAIFDLKGAKYPFEYPEGTEVSATRFLYPVEATGKDG